MPQPNDIRNGRQSAGYYFNGYVYTLEEIGQLPPEEQDIIFNNGNPLDQVEFNSLKSQSMGQQNNQSMQTQGQMPQQPVQQNNMGIGNFGRYQVPGNLRGMQTFNDPVYGGGNMGTTSPSQAAASRPGYDLSNGIWDDKSGGFLGNLWNQRSNKGELTAGLTGMAGTIGNLLFNKPPSGESDKLLTDVTKSVTDSLTESGRNLKQQFRPEYYQRSKEINAIQAAGGAGRLPAGAVGNQIANTGYNHWRAYYDRLTPALDNTIKSTTKSVTDSLSNNLANNAYTRYMANQKAFDWKQGLLGGALNIGMNMLMPGSGMLSKGVGGFLSKLF